MAAVDSEVDTAAVLEAAIVVDSEVVAIAVDTAAVLEVDLGEAEVDMTLVAMIITLTLAVMAIVYRLVLAAGKLIINRIILNRYSTTFDLIFIRK